MGTVIALAVVAGLGFLIVKAIETKKNAELEFWKQHPGCEKLKGRPFTIFVEKTGPNVHFYKPNGVISLKKTDITEWVHEFKRLSSGTKHEGTLIVKTTLLEHPVFKIDIPMLEDEDEYVQRFALLVKA